jgi:GTPase
VDISHRNFIDQIAAVESVIKELGADGKQTLTVFNKVDIVSDPDTVKSQLQRISGSVAISAKTGEGMDQMIQELEHQLSAWRLRAKYRIPVDESALIAEIHRIGHVLEITYEDNTAIITANVPPHLETKLAAFVMG